MQKPIVRKSVSFTPELAGEILKRAIENHRSFSAQVAHDMRVVIERKKHANVTVIENSSPQVHDLVIGEEFHRKWSLEDEE